MGGKGRGREGINTEVGECSYFIYIHYDVMGALNRENMCFAGVFLYDSFTKMSLNWVVLCDPNLILT